jgi:predicted esterase
VIVPLVPLVLWCGCSLTAAPGTPRLNAWPTAPTRTIATGLQALGIAQLLIPASYTPSTPAALVLALRGAGGSSRGPINGLKELAEKNGFLVLAVDSREGTWDAIRGAYGPDIQFIDRALRWTFEHCAVDPGRIEVEGFSDGATYALGIGLANGDLFRQVVAFSPGFIPDTDAPARGKPRIFNSHGFQDPILPKRRTSDLIVPELEKDGYTVRFVEFDGGHTITPQVLQTAVTWSGLTR